MYVKLFGTILRSSVWDESPTTRIVWITLLLEADEDGTVRGVDSRLAASANVSEADFAVSVGILESPDLRSQTQEFGGRRVERIEGGFLVLNYRKYREYRTRSQVRDAEKKRRQRAKSIPHNEIDPDTAPPSCDVPGHVRMSPGVPTIATASSSVVAVRPDVENSRVRGENTNWCGECGGRKEAVGGQPFLRHLTWCGRRT